MKSFIRALLLAAAAFAVATVATQVGPKPQKNSPYAPVLSVAGIVEAQASQPPKGPGCQRGCTTSGCVWLTNRNSTCQMVSIESCVEEACW